MFTKDTILAEHCYSRPLSLEQVDETGKNLEIKNEKLIDGGNYNKTSLTTNVNNHNVLKTNIETEDDDTVELKMDNNQNILSVSGRAQRIRKKPKRWDDETVEVDFSGRSNLLSSVEDVKIRKQEQEVENNETTRKRQKAQPKQPYDRRFMINCDSCDEWFHGKCVNVTKVQGTHCYKTYLRRKMEKLKQEWFCESCLEGFKNNISKEDLKREAEIKRIKLEEEELNSRKNSKSSRRQKSNVRENSFTEDSLISKQRTNNDIKQEDESKSDMSESDLPKPSFKVTDKLLKVSKKSQMEKEEKLKLKKLIKASKKDLNEKQKMLKTKDVERPENIDLCIENNDIEHDVSKESKMKQTSDNGKSSTNISLKVENSAKKKHKSNLVDQSRSDLFKAEPSLVRSQSVSSTLSSSSDSHRKLSVSNEAYSSPSTQNGHTKPLDGSYSCPSGCGKVIQINAIKESANSIYCNADCIQSHVSDSLKYLRSLKRSKEKNEQTEVKPLRVTLINKITGKLISGKEALLEKDVLQFIMKNSQHEIVIPDLTSIKMNTEQSVPNSPKKNQTKHVRIRISLSPIKLERSTSLNERPDDRRKFKELSNKDKAKVLPDSISKLSHLIEEELFKIFKSNAHKYTTKSRSLMFNLKDQKNTLFRKVLVGKITPQRLVNMTPEQLASVELARWRENEKKNTLELIKRDAVEQVNQVIVKKTHKGEEFITDTTLISDISSTIDLKTKNDNTNINTNETKSSENNLKFTSPILDDLGVSGLDILDTTSQHKSHLYSNNCKICTKEQVDESKATTKSSIVTNKSSVTNILSSTNNESEKTQTNRPKPKRVRIELESTNKFLEQVDKISDKFRLDDKQSTINLALPTENISTTTTIADSIISPSNKKSETKQVEEVAKPVWKGTIFMQDVAKFVATAHTISGNITNNLFQDIHDQMTVCGRITPEQVSDYISKLKSSKRTDIGIVEFSWVSREERTGYDAFFNYLNVRGRYGVVGNSGRSFKDFYILPLSPNQDIPSILLPIDGPGLSKKIHRPNLLLGILIRTRKIFQPNSTHISITSTVTQPTQKSNDIAMPERSYTPPLSNCESSLPDDSGSYTPPRIMPSKRNLSSSSNSSKTNKVVKSDSKSKNKKNENSAYINDLMEKVASSSNPAGMTSSVISAIFTSDNHELQRKLLNQLTEKVEDQRLQLKKQQPEEKINTPKTIPGLSNSVSLDNVFNNLKNIQIPDNIRDILNTVQEKTMQIEAEQTRLRISTGNLNSRSGLAEPKCGESTDYLNQSISKDPRLKSKSQISPLGSNHPAASSVTSSSPSQQVASMSQDELLRKAQEQMAALAQMTNSNENNSLFGIGSSSSDVDLREELASLNAVKLNQPTTLTTMPKISFQWKKKK
ncbi:Death-inducer obliterator 1 [Blomia tropicalis]|nr:Death-inducer obliterator 1 [Blomia tropicalis]